MAGGFFDSEAKFLIPVCIILSILGIGIAGLFYAESKNREGRTNRQMFRGDRVVPTFKKPIRLRKDGKAPE
jgi:hypothetical protein